MGSLERETPLPSLLGGDEGKSGAGVSGSLSVTAENSSALIASRKTARYSLHTMIRAILLADARARFPRSHSGDVYRTIDCHWQRVGDVSLNRPQGFEAFHYKGLSTCGNVWACPMCAAKIQERRRAEVALTVVWAEAQGCFAVMASFTFPHRHRDSLSSLLKRQQRALARMRSHHEYKSMMKMCESVGRVRSLEVTHGENGWHPHTHELMFLRVGVCHERFREDLAALWLKCCIAEGLFVEGRDDVQAFLRYSVDVTASSEAASRYLAKLDDQNKWTLAHEVTKSSSKQGRRSGKHPFALASNSETHFLFLTYVQSMKGQKQLVWSRGLKKQVGIEETSDEDLATSESEKVAESIPISVRAWHIVRSNDSRGELLRAAELGGSAGVARLLDLLGVSDERSETNLRHDRISGRRRTRSFPSNRAGHVR